MRPTPNDRIERYRIAEGPMGSTMKDGNNGAFLIPCPTTRSSLAVIVSDGMGWEHVSVSLNVRCPTWAEMCYIKDLFWEDEEVVMQLHPARSNYINNHPYCLHLWKPAQEKIPIPPTMMVGIKDFRPL